MKIPIQNKCFSFKRLQNVVSGLQKTRLIEMKPMDMEAKEGKDILNDPIWSVDVYKIKDRYIQKHQPTLYYLDGGPKRSFVFAIQDL